MTEVSMDNIQTIEYGKRFNVFSNAKRTGQFLGYIIMNNYIRGHKAGNFWASNYIFYSNLVIKSASLVFFLLTAFF